MYAQPDLDWREAEAYTTYRFAWFRFVVALLAWGAVLCPFLAISPPSIHRVLDGDLSYLITPVMTTVFLGGWLYVFAGIAHIRLSVTTDIHGLTYRDGAHIEIFPWDELETVEFIRWMASAHGIGIPIIIQHYYRLKRGDGQEIVIPRQLRDIDQLGKVILDEFVVRKLPVALETLLSGQHLEFGAFSIDQKGISFRRRFVPWQEVAGVQTWGGAKFNLYANGRLLPVSGVMMRKVPNGAVLFSLIEFILMHKCWDCPHRSSRFLQPEGLNARIE